jgi:hypothetical protein
LRIARSSFKKPILPFFAFIKKDKQGFLGGNATNNIYRKGIFLDLKA